MAEHELIVYRKTEFLLRKIYPALVNFPKAEKFCLCQDIKQEFYELLKYISLGNSVKSRRLSYLMEADGHLQLLKVLIRLARSQKYISRGFHKEIDLALTEINKLLSGYIRTTSGKGVNRD